MTALSLQAHDNIIKPYAKITSHDEIYIMLKIPRGMIWIVIGKMKQPFLALFSQLRYYVSLLLPEQTTLVDESGIIRTQMGSTIGQ
jgi:hypothetical protein